MDVFTVIIVGLVATSYILAVHGAIERLHFARSQLIHSVGTFLSTNAVSFTGSGFLVHLLVGVGFTSLYAGIFRLTQPESLTAFLQVGAGIGLAHGTLLSLFLLTDLASIDPDEGDHHRFDIPAVVVNVASHVLYGAVVGSGLGFAAQGGPVVWFAAYAVVLGAAVAGLYLLVIEPITKRRLLKLMLE